MAVPKRKTSKARRDKRRANWKVSMPGMTECPQCGAVKLSHRSMQGMWILQQKTSDFNES